MKKENKSAHVSFRLTTDEKKKVELYAKESNLELTDYCRMVLLRGYVVKVQVSIPEEEPIDRHQDQIPTFRGKIETFREDADKDEKLRRLPKSAS